MEKWNNTLKYMFSDVSEDIVIKELNKLLEIGKHNAVDRTNVNELFICTPIPSSILTVDLFKIIASRGEYLMSSLNSPHLMWSGGIDSTTAFYSLLATGKEFTVIFNSNSIAEYPDLGNAILNKAYSNVIPLFVDETFRLLEYIQKHPEITIITGEIGDQLFGSNSIFNYDPLFKNKTLSECMQNNVVNIDILRYVEPSILKVLNLNSLEGLTLSEYHWALNFIFKYQTVQLRVANMGLRAFGANPNAKHFFDTNEFNSYAIQNYKVNNAYDESNKYKLPLKYYIYFQNNDAVYLRTKTKHRSLRETKY